jgi:L-2,4-diaminobutyrate decarboxylase
LPFCHDKRRQGYLAHLDVPPADLSIASGVLIRALAQDPVTWTSARAGTFLEEEVVRWLADLVFPGQPDAGGIACAGGTQANLHAVLLARNLLFAQHGCDVGRVGLAEAQHALARAHGVRKVRVLVSSAAHGSLAAAVRHAGLGDDNLDCLPTDANDAVRVDALEEALERAARLGDRVALVALTAGTVGVGAVDPLQESVALARRYGARVHVDAAHGAMLLLSRRYAPRLAGIECADSVTADPHKILGLNQGLGMLFLRDREDREGLAKDPAPYFAVAPGAPSSSRYTLDGTRPLSALSAWILLRHLGRAGYERVVDHVLGLSTRFTDAVVGTGLFELYAPPRMNLVAFRPTHGGDDAVRRLLAAIAETPFRAGPYATSRGLFLRTVFVNPATTADDVDRFVRVLRAAAESRAP